MFLKCNIINLAAFYAGLECQQDSSNSASEKSYSLKSNRLLTVDNNTLAMEFVKQAIYLWVFNQGGSRVELFLQLQKNGFLMSEDIKRIFLVPLVAELKEIR